MRRKRKGYRNPPKSNWRSTRSFYYLYRMEGTVGCTIYLRRIDRVSVVPEERRGHIHIRYDGFLYPVHDPSELQTLVNDAKAGKFMMRGPNLEDCAREKFDHLSFICEGEAYRPYYRW